MAMSLVRAPIATRAGGRFGQPQARLRIVHVRSSVENKQPQVVRPHPPARDNTFEEVMGFSGAAPEIINGRLAQIGFLAALGAELFTQKPVLAQLNGSTIGPIFTTFALVAAASLVPILRGIKNDESFGPFTPAAEIKNGRFAMIGFLALLIVEGFKGSALF